MGYPPQKPCKSLIFHTDKTEVYHKPQRRLSQRKRTYCQGAIYGYDQSIDNAYMTRIEQRTPFKGLYLASAWTKPGGGYQPCLGSGADAFKALVKDLADI